MDGMKRLAKRPFADTGDARQFADANAFRGVAAEKLHRVLNQSASGGPRIARPTRLSWLPNLGADYSRDG